MLCISYHLKAVLYVIAGFATIGIGTDQKLKQIGLGQDDLSRSLEQTDAKYKIELIHQTWVIKLPILTYLANG